MVDDDHAARLLAPITGSRLWRFLTVPRPHYSPLVRASRYAINYASAMWAWRALGEDNALATTSYAVVGTYIGENLLATIVMAIAVVQTLWLVLRLRQFAVGMIGYFMLLVGWSGIMYAVILASPPQPTAFASVSTLCAIAFIAFVIGHGCDGKPS